MLHKKEFVEVGFIRKPHGFKGYARVAIDDLFLDDINQQEFIFIQVDGYYVPFRIEEFGEQRDYVLKLKSLENPDDLKEYHLSKLFLLKEDLVYAAKSLDDHNELRQLTGYTLIDQYSNKSGPIVRIEEYPQQLMAIVEIKSNEYLIPLHHDIIVEINQESATITMNLPEGLV